METPNWNFNLVREKDVYEPSEDTFLLLDSLERDLENLTDHNPRIILEIGSGSGVIITALAKLLKSDTFCIAVDVNPKACMVTANTAELNGINVDVIQADLLEAFQLRGIVDVIIFNPPYIETEIVETTVAGIAQSWAGGKGGRQVIDRLFSVLWKAISPNGIFYLVSIGYNDIYDIMKRMDEFGFAAIVLNKRQIRGELLYVLKFTKIRLEYSLDLQLNT